MVGSTILLKSYKEAAEYARIVFELDEMLAIKERDGPGSPPRSMTLKEAIRYHLKIRRHNLNNINSAHEAGHLIYALACKKIFGFAPGYEYQGNENAEMYAERLEARIKALAWGQRVSKNAVIKTIQEYFYSYYEEDIKFRILLWQAGKKLRLTLAQLRASRHNTWKTDEGLTELAGLSLWRVDKEGKGYVTSDDPGKPYAYRLRQKGYYVDDNPRNQYVTTTTEDVIEHLPCGSNGFDDFKPLIKPTAAYIGRFYDYTQPAIDLIASFITPLKRQPDEHDLSENPRADAYLDRIFSKIKMSDLADAINKMPTPKVAAKRVDTQRLN